MKKQKKTKASDHKSKYKYQDKLQKPTPDTRQKSCMNCMKGIPTGMSNDILCREKGIVSGDYVCVNHRFFVMDDINRLEVNKCATCQFFIFHPHPHLQTYGVCDLFSVRKVDGSLRKACSRYVRRKVLSA